MSLPLDKQQVVLENSKNKESVPALVKVILHSNYSVMFPDKHFFGHIHIEIYSSKDFG